MDALIDHVAGQDATLTGMRKYMCLELQKQVRLAGKRRSRRDVSGLGGVFHRAEAGGCLRMHSAHF
eukprot:104101-Chlamydomonas_euryale.AAC.1